MRDFPGHNPLNYIATADTVMDWLQGQGRSFGCERDINHGDHDGDHLGDNYRHGEHEWQAGPNRYGFSISVHVRF